MKPTKVKIYTLICPLSNQVKYVGKAVDPLWKRLACHWCKCDKEDNHKANWLKKLKRRGLKPLIRLVEKCEESVWEEREQFWIAEFKSHGCSMVNATDGGLGTRGLKRSPKQTETRLAKKFKHSEESKKKMSEASKGRAKSASHKRALSKAKKGVSRDNAVKLKIGKSMRGKKKTKEHIEKIAQKRRQPVVCILDSGEKVYFISITVAAESTGKSASSIRNYLSGKTQCPDSSIWVKMT